MCLLEGAISSLTMSLHLEMLLQTRLDIGVSRLAMEGMPGGACWCRRFLGTVAN